ncbi:MAG TPA: 3-hydroxybutyrate oligomer hydrolase family protein [Gammaproteobacteria bacterium]|nr:3-hydroxybutyrate oligomer hydrolase family protein [Gammaproteobacteria bacterium]
MPRPWLVAAISLAITGCAPAPRPPAALMPAEPGFLAGAVRETHHAGEDDLLSAGLGLAGLRSAAPMPVDPAAPTAAELRRLAIHSNWTGIADLDPQGGIGSLYGGVPAVPGREYQAFALVAGAQQPHRVLAQVPDAFDLARPCLLVAPASGSRGVYGPIALAGGYGLPRGCAVAYTDKGAGSDYFDCASGTGTLLDGTRGPAGAGLAFEPQPVESPLPLVAMKHAHSGDHPEADWGRHAIQAALFGLHALDRAFPTHAPFTPQNTTVIAASVSNGGGAVLRALELDSDRLFAAGLAVAPNITAPGARPLYDIATEAALLHPCLLGLPEARDWPLYHANPLIPAAAAARCASLAELGVIAGADPAAAALEVRDRLLAEGHDLAALEQAAINVGFDIWRAVGATYASSYLRRPAHVMPCGFGLAMLDEKLRPRAASAEERALWWANTTGVAPTGGIGLLDAGFAMPDPFLAGQRCLRELWTGGHAEAEALRAAVAETGASAQLPERPVLIIHGGADGLVPAAFSSRPYVAAVRANGGRHLAYWEIERVQHFDAFLGPAGLGARYLPLMPYAYLGLDELFAHLFGDGPKPADRSISPPPRSGVLDRAGLGIR